MIHPQELHGLEPDDCKRFATLEARAALSGITLHRIWGGEFAPSVYVASKWALNSLRFCEERTTPVEPYHFIAESEA